MEPDRLTSFKFIHAADLHLDSPLTGLAVKSYEYARRVDEASRIAFTKLIDLAIDENCSFMVIAGDLFDGQWKDYRTGLFFANQMARLRDAGIPVFIVLGNHDAENRFVSRLKLTDNVSLFSSKSPHTYKLPALNVAIHGQSFPTRDVTTNLAAGYPQAVPGWFNIGVLHTNLGGISEHANYAPCSLQTLKNKGYQYLSLIHISEPTRPY